MEIEEGRRRVVIANVYPQIEEGHFAIKRVVGDEVSISADVFADGHSQVAAQLLFRKAGHDKWHEIPMHYIDNDRWKGTFKVNELGIYEYTLHAWVDNFLAWQKDLQKKFDGGLKVDVDLLFGIKMIEETLTQSKDAELKEFHTALKKTKDSDEAVSLATDPRLHALMRNRFPNKQWVTEYEKILKINVDPIKARFSTWYEMFPRSSSPQAGKHGTFKDCMRMLPHIAEMGFDVLYFPPIHPIGLKHRRSGNNLPNAKEDDPGSPWAVGGKEGGHTAIHPQLGSFEDFEKLRVAANQHGIDVALDLAFQCSPDHPYLTEHPDWFRYRPDGTIQYAENPPKKYEDIVPFYFETEHWTELWQELREIVLFWIDKGIRIFRVDNPHTKPFIFWEWLISDVKQAYPEVIFLAEAFTRPKVMYWLAKLGFSQSYTYFTWRHTKKELTDYIWELTATDVKEYFRPNFWPNTPDILSEELQFGGRPAFIVRLILAATLSSNYGIYGPAFELLENKALPGKEEYVDSEKYEIRKRTKQIPESISDIIKKVNRIRRENPVLQYLSNIKIFEVDNDQIMYYGRVSPDQENSLLIVVNLDPFNPQTGNIKVPLKMLQLPENQSYRVHELLTDRQHIWEGGSHEITLDPEVLPASIFRIQKKVRKEVDFEYFM